MQKTLVLTGRLKMDHRRLFRVYLVGHGSGCYAKEYRREFMGQTLAVSAGKAISNIMYRLRQRGEYLPDDLEDSMGMGYVHYELEAEAV